jgi:hypothetical protein
MLRRESATAKKTEPVEMITNSIQILRERHEIYEPSFDVREFGKQLGMDIADLNERVGEGVDLLKEHIGETEVEMTPSQQTTRFAGQI